MSSVFSLLDLLSLKKLKKEYGIKTETVPYIHREEGVVKGRDLHIVFLSKEGDRDLPVFAFVQGSAWHKQKFLPTVKKLAKMTEMGYLVALIEYRYTDEGAYLPSQVFDAKEAIAYLHKHAHEHGGDDEHVVIAGDSSGGHTALLAGMTMANRYFPVEGDTKVDAIVDFYAPTDPGDPDGFPSAPGGAGSEKSHEGKLFGGRKLSTIKEEVDKAVVMNYVNEDFAPVFIEHGTGDKLVAFHHALRLHEALKKAGKKHHYELLDGAVHGGSPFYTEENLEKVDAFIREEIGG